MFRDSDQSSIFSEQVARSLWDQLHQPAVPPCAQQAAAPSAGTQPAHPAVPTNAQTESPLTTAPAQPAAHPAEPAASQPAAQPVADGPFDFSGISSDQDLQKIVFLQVYQERRDFLSASRSEAVEKRLDRYC